MRSSADRPAVQRTARPKKRGFSLLEMLVAIAVAAVGFLTIFELFPMGFAASAKAESRAIAAAIASDLLSRFRQNLAALPRPTYTTSPSFAAPISSAEDTNETTIKAWTDWPSTSPKAFQNCSVDPAGASLVDATSSKGQTIANTYYYRAIIHEVIDPGLKYAPAITPYSSISTSNQFLTVGITDVNARYSFRQRMVGLRRVTVFVRGPFVDSGDANAFDTSGSKRNTGAVEVRMAAYVADARLGDTTLVDAAAAGATRLHVYSLYGFSVYSAGQLTDNEKLDTGPPIPSYNSGTGGAIESGSDSYGLDNIWLGDDTGNLSTDNELAYTSESNKIVQVELQSDGTGYLYLLHPISGTKTQVITGTAPNTVTTYTYTSYPATTKVRSKVTLHRKTTLD